MSIVKLKYTLPLLLITVGAIGGVKFFYYFVEQKMEAETTTTAVSLPAAGDDQAAGSVSGKLDRQPDVSAITRRNLFASRDKAPPVIEKEPQAEIGPSSLAVVLMGTITGTDGVERAIIYDKKERKQELYQIGDYLQQAAVKEIMRGKVIITLNGRDEILDITAAREVKVPQYAKPGPPVTTAQRVVGRPVVERQVPGQSEDEEQAEQGMVVPQPRSVRRMITNNKQGVIIKGRAADVQSEQAN